MTFNNSKNILLEVNENKKNGLFEIHVFWIIIQQIKSIFEKFEEKKNNTVIINKLIFATEDEKEII